MTQQKLNLLHLSAGDVAQADTRPPQIVRSDSREAELGRVLLDDMPNDSLGHAVTPGLSGSTTAPRHPTGGDSRGRQPVVNRLLHPVGNRNGPDVSTLSNQVHDRQWSSRRWSRSTVGSASSRRRRPQPSRTARRARSRLPFRVSVSGACQRRRASCAVNQFPSRTPSF